MKVKVKRAVLQQSVTLDPMLVDCPLDRSSIVMSHYISARVISFVRSSIVGCYWFDRNDVVEIFYKLPSLSRLRLRVSI